ncbi:MTR protein, partial [Indicator maculatus]|nr:MTR protein [Indicator maculatus]
QIHIFSLRDVGNGVYDCWADFIQPWGPKAYVTWITLMVYIIPVLMLSICYGLISFKIWQNVKLKMAPGPGPGTALSPCARGGQASARGPCSGQAFARVSSTRLISKAKIRTVKMTFIIVLAFIVCWTPFFFVQMWSVWDTNAPQEASPFIIAMLLASLNSCCNPWIYMLYTGHLFHDLVRRLLCCSRRCLKSRPACHLPVARKNNSSSFVLSCKSTSQRSFVQPSTT